MKCVVEGCKALSRGNGVGKNGEYCLRHGGRRYPRKCTYHGCNHYILRSKLCAKHYLEKELRLHNTGVVDIQQQVNCTLPKQECALPLFKYLCSMFCPGFKCTLNCNSVNDRGFIVHYPHSNSAEHI